MTLNEYLAIPRADRHMLLLYGNVIDLPRPGARGNHALNNLGVMLDRWTRRHQMGEVRFGLDMIFDSEKALVHAPDLL